MSTTTTINVYASEAAAKAAGATIDNETTFTSIAAATKAAAVTGTTEIIVHAGTYSEDVALTVKEIGQKGDIVIKAATGETVNMTGTVTVGYYEKGVAAQGWKAAVALEGLNFKPAEGDTSLDIQSVSGLTVKNCNFATNDDGETFVVVATGSDCSGMVFENCTFENGRVKPRGIKDENGVNMQFKGCTFKDTKTNIEGGTLIEFDDCDFNVTLKATKTDGTCSTYAIRSNDVAVNVTNSTFNIDSDGSANGCTEGDFGILWARRDGSTQWKVENVEVNYTPEAEKFATVENDFVFINNATTADKTENEANRITVTNLTDKSTALDTLATSTGTVNAYTVTEENGEKEITYTQYSDGVAGDPVNLSGAVLVNSAYTASSVLPTGFEFGVNAFATFAEAYDKSGVESIMISGGLVTFPNTTSDLKCDIVVNSGATLKMQDSNLKSDEYKITVSAGATLLMDDKDYDTSTMTAVIFAGTENAHAKLQATRGSAADSAGGDIVWRAANIQYLDITASTIEFSHDTITLKDSEFSVDKFTMDIVNSAVVENVVVNAGTMSVKPDETNSALFKNSTLNVDTLNVDGRGSDGVFGTTVLDNTDVNAGTVNLAANSTVNVDIDSTITADAIAGAGKINN